MATPARFGQQFAAGNEALRHFGEYATKVNELAELCARLLQVGQQLSTLMARKGTTGSMMSQMEKMQEMNQSFNMQYLNLQQRMQDESRRFSLLSNILKTKHDTAKNSISNLR